MKQALCPGSGVTPRSILISLLVGISGGILLVLITSSIYINEIKSLWKKLTPNPTRTAAHGKEMFGSDDDMSEKDDDSDTGGEGEELSGYLNMSVSSGVGPIHPHPSFLERALDKVRRRDPGRRKSPDAERAGSPVESSNSDGRS